MIFLLVSLSGKYGHSLRRLLSRATGRILPKPDAVTACGLPVKAICMLPVAAERRQAVFCVVSREISRTLPPQHPSGRRSQRHEAAIGLAGDSVWRGWVAACCFSIE